jgi:hypothetical protein
MDEFFGLRAEMEAAIRQDDAARDRYDRFERKWAEHDTFTVWGAAGPRLREVLKRDGERIVCPQLGTGYPAAA